MTPAVKACVCGAAIPRREGRAGRGRRYCSEVCAVEARAQQQRERLSGKMARCNYCAARLSADTTRHYCDDRCERLAQRGVRTYEQRDLTAAEIETRFQRAKAWIRYRRAMAQG